MLSQMPLCVSLDLPNGSRIGGPVSYPQLLVRVPMVYMHALIASASSTGNYRSIWAHCNVASILVNRLRITLNCTIQSYFHRHTRNGNQPQHQDSRVLYNTKTPDYDANTPKHHPLNTSS